MKDKKFWTMFWVVLALCIGLTAAHLIYVVQAYQNCSIIYFISRELW